MNATHVAISSDSGKVNQIPFKPIRGNSINDKGMIIINCLVSVIINETGPFPNDSKTPDITMANVEKIKLKDKIRKPVVPIASISWFALNNCNIEATHTAIGFWGGCTDEEFRNENTQILTILGGNYKSSKQNNGSPLEIRTYADPNTYFNPKDFVLQGGTFETLSDGLGAIRLLGPRKRWV